jgi:DNA mismatch endonuclease (patch repair protein)
MDTVAPEVRSRMMRKVGRRDTTPERTVRSVAHRLGLRFRLCDPRLPGSPDLVFKRHRVVLFVHGCFWHHHDCRRGTVPKSRTDYWIAKFRRNVGRDRRIESQLQALGWKVVVVWECETSDVDALRRRLAQVFGVDYPDQRPRPALAEKMRAPSEAA